MEKETGTNEKMRGIWGFLRKPWQLFCVPGDEFRQTFITFDRNGGMRVDVAGLLASGRMDRQLNAMRQLAEDSRKNTRNRNNSTPITD